MAQQTNRKPDPQRVVTDEVRLSFVNAFTPKESKFPGGKPSYSVVLLIPKSDVATKARIDAAIEAAKEVGKEKKWGGKVPFTHIPIHDGDGVKETSQEPYGPECHNCWVLNASRTDMAPEVIDASRNPILDQSELYSGCYGKVSLRFYPYNKGKNGVGCGLCNIMKTRDGDPLSSSGNSAEDDFGGDDLM